MRRSLTVKFFIEKGQGHILGTLGGGGSVRLFNNFDEARQGCEGSHTEHEKRAYD